MIGRYGPKCYRKNCEDPSRNFANNPNRLRITKSEVVILLQESLALFVGFLFAMVIREKNRTVGSMKGQNGYTA